MEMEIVVKTSKRQNTTQKSVWFTNSLRSEFSTGAEILSKDDIYFVSVSNFNEVELLAAQAIINIAEKYEIEKDLTCNFQYSVREGLNIGNYKLNLLQFRIF